LGTKASLSELPLACITSVEEADTIGADMDLIAYALTPITRGGHWGLMGNIAGVLKAHSFLQMKTTPGDWRVELSQHDIGFDDVNPQGFTYFLCPLCGVNWI
jgi:hypothetical protein